MANSLSHIRRLIATARTLARYDALFPLEPLPAATAPLAILKLLFRRRSRDRPGVRLAKACQVLGPSFIKLGQSLSTRPDLLGEDVAQDLSHLQDQLPPFSASDARRIIEEELGAPVDELFQSFDDTPVAAASIAQVHLAVTSDGDEVAVKVLRPGIERAFSDDIDFFRWLARIVERNRPDLRRLKPIDVIETFAESVRLEMDLRLEAAAAEELAENFAGDPDYRIPAIDWQRTARRVLTLERVSGIPIDEKEKLTAAGHDLEQIVTKAGAIFFKQVFRDGFFHADQHPGNLFVADDGAIVAIDFGIMGRIDRAERRYLGEMLMSFLKRDYRRVAEVHFEAGYVSPRQSVQAFTQACRSIAEPILDKPQNEISMARLLAHLFQVTETFEMETQPQLLLLQKTMLVAEGIGRTLCPDANIWLLAQPLIEEWVEQNMGPETQIVEATEEVVGSLRRLPRILSNVEKSAAMFTDGGLKLHPETLRQMTGGGRTDRSLAKWLYSVVAILLIGWLIFG